MKKAVLEPKVIYEDPNFLAIDKPAGLLVYERRGEKRELPTLADWLRKHYPETVKVGDNPGERPGLVHRLDKDTSGVMLVARNQDTFLYLKELFAKRRIKKTYLALVYGELKPARGLVQKPIALKPGSLKRTVWRGKKEKEAITAYRVKRYFQSARGDKFTLVEVMPLTGRTHQIRVHLAALGHPVVGDRLYAAKKLRESLPSAERQALHAYSLEFAPQPGQRLRLAANLPAALRRLLRSLKAL